MKAQTVQRFNDRLSQFESPEIREKFFSDLQEGDLSDARVLDDLKAHSIDPEMRKEMEQRQQANIEKFKETFAADAGAQAIADKAQALMQQVRDNPDPKTFRLLEDLRNQLSPDQQSFVKNLEATGQAEMKQRFQEEPTKFVERFSTANPEDFSYLGDFQKNFGADFSPQFRQQFNNTINDSAGQVRERKEFIDERAKQAQEQAKQTPDQLIKELFCSRTKHYTGMSV